MIRLALSCVALLAPALAGAASQAPAPVASADEVCRPSPEDRSWLVQAIANWRTSERTILKLDPAPLPTIVTVDARCVYTLAPGTDSTGAWPGRPHEGEIVFPDGKKAPLGPISFASAGERPGDPSYFAMSLPSVWQSAAVKSGLGTARLMDGVMLHEFMHSRQFYFVVPELAKIAAHHGAGDDINDDSLQARFEKDADYTAAYRTERDTLFAAADAPSDAAARALARKALAQLRARRARWFTGAQAYWSQYDDVFLAMEGLGQWLAFSWYVSPSGPGLTRAAVLPEVRRGGKFWSQDEGLALFLVIDRLVPNWQKLAFANRPLLAEALLARAAGEPAPRPQR